MHSCRLLMEIPSMERHRTVHDIIAIGVLKGVGGEQQFRILRNSQNNFFFSRSIDSSDQSNQSRKIDRQKMIFSNWMMAICKNRTKNLKSKWQSTTRESGRIEKKKNEKNRLFQFWFPKEMSGKFLISNLQNYQENDNVLGTRLNDGYLPRIENREAWK